MLNTFDHSQFDRDALLSLKRETVSVCVPTRETAATIEPIVREIVALREDGLVDQLLVVDADSADGTAALAAGAGAEAVSEAELLPAFGPVRGKGDAMWRALSALRGEIVVYLDGDVRDFGPHYVTGLLGPLLAEGGRFDFVKGFYRRPLSVESAELPDGGGRVTELTAKPLLELFVPELAAFRQPLAGELAARRSLLEQVPFACGYGVEIAMLVEVWRRVGLERMAQVDLLSKRNSHQSLAQLGQMSREVIAALLGQVGAAEGAQPLPLAAEATTELETRPPWREAILTSPNGGR
jgi:glucosyl-3-phosphoglycerate synthase